MVICVRTRRLSAAIIIPLILFSAKPTKCQLSTTERLVSTKVVTEVVTEYVESPVKDLQDDDLVDTDQLDGTDPEAGEIDEIPEGDDYPCENSPTYENENYEEFYDDNEEDASKERNYGRFLLIGSAILLLLGLCGIICFTRRRGREDCSVVPSVTTCFRSCKVGGEDEGCVINFMKATPDLSEAESDAYQNIPLPLIYEDMGKICNNAEMFIQRCMTSSVKRTYSEPVKTITSSKTKFRDYIKELAYLKEKQTQECSKHGAVRAFFKEMFKLFKRTQIESRRQRESSKEKQRAAAKEVRVKIEDSTKGITSPQKNVKTGKSPDRKGRKSSSSISITSLLLKPQYQSKYYKKDNTFDTYKTRKKDTTNRKQRDRRKYEGERVPLILNQKKPNEVADPRRLEISKDFRQHKICPQDTEELIKMCVNTMRQPFNKRFITLFDHQNMEQFNGLPDIAATMTKKMEERRERFLDDRGRGEVRDPYMDRAACLPSCSRQVVPLKPKLSKEGGETFDLLVKQLYYMASNSRNLPQSDHTVPFFQSQDQCTVVEGNEIVAERLKNSEDDSRFKMIKKYQELQLEVERLNKSLRQFATDFLYPEKEISKKPLTETTDEQKKNQPSYRDHKRYKK